LFTNSTLISSEELETYVERLNVSPALTAFDDPLVSVRFDDADEAVDALASALDEAGIEFVINRHLEFDPHELESASVLRMIVTTAERELRSARESSFDDTHRSTCANQTLVVDPGALPERQQICRSMLGEIFVTQPIKLALQQAGAKNDFTTVKSKHTKQQLPWFRLDPALTMPPLPPDTPGLVRLNRSSDDEQGYFQSLERPLQLSYGEASLKQVTGLAKTRELFGVSTSVEHRGAQPLILVAQSAYQRLRAMEPDEVEFEPVLALVS
jgi:hypothetical protein